VRAIFSDLDGTLVHFPQWFGKHGVIVLADGGGGDPTRAVVESATGERRECRVLPESTMGPGFVSDRTVELVDSLRAHGALFVVITAARKSTLLERLPFLPRCDVAVCECGARIYYGDELDLAWARTFEHISGPLDTPLSPDERPQPLWQLYREMRDAGLSCDTRSYTGCFRVATASAAHVALVERFRAGLDPSVIGSAENLGKVDFFPALCGKGNAVKYLQAKFGVRPAECAALFDDDNDLPMAAECAVHLLPALTSDSVVSAVRVNPAWRVAERCGQGVFAIEELLEALLETHVRAQPVPLERAA
jgi:3-deoxy-D-manno-octulosonate 8-phosphate phosphatase KdsC-like HAD superfamily phosphatase